MLKDQAGQVSGYEIGVQVQGPRYELLLPMPPVRFEVSAAGGLLQG